MIRLTQHKSIALDFDGTFIDHPASHLLWDYVIRHATDGTKFWFVTFRDPDWAKDIWDDLRKTKSLVRPWHLEGIVSQTDEMWEKKRTDQSVLESDEWIHWKAIQAKNLGCTLMIDDRPSWVKAGCHKYGVEYIHPDTLEELS
jgi:hypothetical protein